MSGEMIEVKTGKTWSTFWHMIGYDNDKAYEFSVRSDLMGDLFQHIQACGWTSDQAANAFGVNIARIEQLFESDIAEFTIEDLVEMAKSAKIGMHFAETYGEISP